MSYNPNFCYYNQIGSLAVNGYSNSQTYTPAYAMYPADLYLKFFKNEVDSMKKIIRKMALSGVALMLMLAILVAWPQRVKRTDKIFGVNGQDELITLDISLHRCVSGIRMSGSIFYDGEKYVNVKDIFGKKWEGESNYFIIPGDYALESMEKCIILDINDNRMKSYVILIKTPEGISKYTNER